MQKLDSSIMIIVWEHGLISPHVVRDHRELLC
jgi:hypothetical protein